ncbi:MULTISPECIES: helix-turn-helix domain-containing protein [unclassified Janthinobacterium]|uniref:AraC family transcriptional regulator n=1 Tax=unclassified Janthinobacterium TaxID=2610881 RepID=UPI00160FE3D2|nr:MULTISPECIES: helix-turn-helix transcriptional regulator [unclassified Janthinobacterium]MBB5371264.1 AraC-like DNA-binding protein [Janthinobacterium sp. K2C7]MBB5384070.1 AraC-like DNA-binding protein [Janthinobacterium sp. K2Li3]MBB5389470.1 AraC-like DNA-binding protein [Janthinobacterium sp. K2E3]
MQELEQTIPDFSEQADGPPLIVLWSDDGPKSQFQLGTREVDWHRHVRGQMMCVESGVVHVRTRQGSWILPPHRAGWLPPGQEHKVSIAGSMSGWSLLLAPDACAGLPAQPCVIGSSEVLVAMVRRAATWPQQAPLTAAQQRMMAVLLDELADAPQEPLHLPMPADRRLLAVAKAVLAQPDSQRSLQEWALWGAMSARTLSRLFPAETGMSFAQWRTQAGLLHALERLAHGDAVAEIAHSLGYATPSNFIAMFRRSLGVSPGRYFKP